MRPTDDDTPVWIDGERVSLSQAAIPLDDPGVLSGLGLFETFGVDAGRVLDADAHLDRFAVSARILDVPLPDRVRLRDDLVRAAAEVEGPGWVKLVATRGGARRVFAGPIDPAEVGRSVRVVVLPWVRSRRDPLVGHKSLNYAASEMGLREARRRGADEGLWRNERGHLTEACTANLFVIRGQALFTAAVSDGLLPGVTRALVLDAAREAGLAIHEGRLRMKRLLGAREAFLSSSVRGIRPVLAIDGRAVGHGEPGRWTSRLAEALASRRVRG